MAQPRTGASAPLLPDGRVLIAGGDGANGPAASAELFNGDGSFSPAAPMRVARSKHVSIALQDRRAGGRRNHDGWKADGERRNRQYLSRKERGSQGQNHQAIRGCNGAARQGRSRWILEYTR